MNDSTWRSATCFGTVALFLLFACVGPGAAAEAGKDGDPVFVGYLYGKPRKINFGLYTHLCHAFSVPNEDGTIRESRGVPSRSLTEEAHKAGVKVLLSLGGWGWDKQFAAIAADPKALDRYVKSVIKLVDENDYDGTDLDWEYPDSASEIPGFEQMTRRFRRELDELGRKKGRPMLQTMAVAANPSALRWMKKEVLVETMDWLNVMTYDYAGPWLPYAGHNSPLFASSKQPDGAPRSIERTMDFLVKEHGMPPGKLAVGIPLYGRGFAVAEPYASTRNAPARPVAGGGGYAGIDRLLKKGWTRQWDKETKTPWLIAPDKSSVIGYDDVESVSIKTEWAMKQGFRGVFFWHVGADLMPDGSNPLQEASHREWRERGSGRATTAP